MKSKSLLIAIAAFAVTTTGVYAYSGSKTLSRYGFSASQITAIEEAREKKEKGDLSGARDVLLAAGLTEEQMQSLRQAHHDIHHEIHQALKDGNYEAFMAAIVDTPLADIVTSEEDFEQFREAHKFKLENHGSGMEHAEKNHRKMMGKVGETSKHDYRQAEKFNRPMPGQLQFTADQLEALRVAREANDRATIQAIYDEAGFERHHRYGH